MSLKKELLIALSFKLLAMGLIWQLWFAAPAIDQGDTDSRAAHLLGERITPAQTDHQP